MGDLIPGNGAERLHSEHWECSRTIPESSRPGAGLGGDGVGQSCGEHLGSEVLSCYEDTAEPKRDSVLLCCGSSACPALPIPCPAAGCPCSQQGCLTVLISSLHFETRQ